jgi:hypothetical protein
VMGSRQVDSCKKTKDSLTRKKKEEEEEVIWAFQWKNNTKCLCIFGIIYFLFKNIFHLKIY